MSEETIEENIPSCNEVLEQAKDKLESVLIIGIGKEGEKEGYYAGTTSDVDKIVSMIDKFKEFILNSEEVVSDVATGYIVDTKEIPEEGNND